MKALRQRLFFGEGDGLRLGGEAFEFGGDHAVVSRGGGEDFAGQLEARGERGVFGGLQFRGYAMVIGGIGDDGDALEIFGGGAQHGGSTDINVFDELAGGEVCLGRGFGEGIKIHDHQVYRRDAVLGGLLLVFLVAAAEQQSAVHFGVQCFHAAAEHFGPAGKFGDVFYGHAGVAQQLRGATGGQYLDAQRGQPPGKFQDAGLVKNTDECALHRHVLPPRAERHNSVSVAPVAKAKMCGGPENVLIEDPGGKIPEVWLRGKSSGENYDLTRAFSLTWPSRTSTTYSTSWQFFCFCRSLVFFSTNSLKLERVSFSVGSPAFCLACRKAS